MTMQPEAPEAPETEGRSGLSRRTVLKAGAHAAWMVPAITIVTQAPALATSGKTLGVTPTSTGWTGTGSGDATFPIEVDLTNPNDQATAGLLVTLQFPTGWTPTVPAATAPVGWTVGGSGTQKVTFGANAANQLGAKGNGGFTAYFMPSSTTKAGLAVPGISVSATTSDSRVNGGNSVDVADVLIVNSFTKNANGSLDATVHVKNTTAGVSDVTVSFSWSSAATKPGGTASGWTVAKPDNKTVTFTQSVLAGTTALLTANITSPGSGGITIRSTGNGIARSLSVQTPA